MPSICLSVVSHAQTGLVEQFLKDLADCGAAARIDRLVLTSNLPEPEIDPLGSLDFVHRENRSPRGFAANHNRAFELCEARYFCVANPDIRLERDPFPDLLACLEANPQAALAAPAVVSPDGVSEDNARHFPTPWSLLRKARGLDDGRYLEPMQGPTPVDWTAGMFLLIRAEAFRAIGGFDDKFHLYYEDVDLCARFWKAGWGVLLHPGVTIEHDAQRASRKNLRYMAWHAASMARYFVKHIGRLPRAF